MSTHEIELREDVLRQLRTYGLEPTDTGVARGSQHTLRAEVRRQERRGEVVALWVYEVLDPRTGQLQIPYIRLREHSAVQRERLIRWTAFWIGAALGLAGVLYALWTVRVFIVVTLVLAVVAVLVMRFLPHLSRGCSGLHCSGCRG